MPDPGYAVVALDDQPLTRHGESAAWASLTGPLGATEACLDAVRLDAEASFELAAEPEQLLVALDGAVTIGDDGTAIDPRRLGRLPADVGEVIRADGTATVLLVAASADPDPDATPVAVDLDAVEFVVPETSDVATAFLTAALGCAGMKVNARRIEPGQAVPYHTEGTQEELFVPVSGPASLLVDDDSHPMGAGAVTRVAPDVPRSAVNDGDEDAVWVMVGAPPTGGPTGWDPGAEILE